MMMRPAWSQEFSPEALRYPEPITLIDEITPEWAWGGSTGKGVRVGVVDSGIDADHPDLGGMVRGGVTVVERDGQISFDESPHGGLRARLTLPEVG